MPQVSKRHIFVITERAKAENAAKLAGPAYHVYQVTDPKGNECYVIARQAQSAVAVVAESDGYKAKRQNSTAIEALSHLTPEQREEIIDLAKKLASNGDS